MNSVEFIIATLCGALIGYNNFTIPLYIFYMVFLAINFYKFFKNGKKDIQLIKIIIFSCILPDNYIIIGISFLISFILMLKNKGEKIKVNYFIFIIVLYVILNIVINGVMIPNLVFSLVYTSTIFIVYYIYKEIGNVNKESESEIYVFLKQIVIMQFVSVIVYALTHIQFITNSIDYDWVVGTFGQYQGNIFLFFMFFSFLVFERHYKNTKDRKDIIFMIISILISIMTGSIALLLGMFIIYIISWVFGKNNKNKIKRIFLLFGVVLFFIVVTPAWIKNYIVRLTDYTYFKNNIQKVDTYENTFVNIPQNDIKFFIFGNGIGQYSSRAALTCTGLYIDKYKDLSMSEYTKNYIYSNLKYVMDNHLGSMSTPYSSIITVQGEFGIIGLGLLIIAFIILLKKNKSEAIRIYLAVFMYSLFIENYLEFAKIIFMIFLIMFINNKNVQSNNECEEIGKGEEAH